MNAAEVRTQLTSAVKTSPRIKKADVSNGIVAMMP